MSYRYPHKNASTFNPFDQTSANQKSLDDQEKQKKKDMQNFYRDQLSNVGPSQQSSQDYPERKHWEVKQSSNRNQYARDNDAGGYFGQDNDRTNDDLNKKKRLQEEMVQANQRAIQQKEAQKRQDKAHEKENDRRRVEEAVFQYEQENVDKHEKQRRVVEQNDKMVQQQRKEFNSRNNKKEQENIPSQSYEDYEPTTHHRKHFERVNQTSDYENLSSGMQDLNVKGKVHRHDAGDSMRGLLQQSSHDNQPQQPSYGKGSVGQDRSQSDYQKNRDRMRQGNSYNIISGNM